MILAAGLGTRLRPLTDHIPKALIKVRDVTLLEHAVTLLKNQGVTEIIINTHHHAQQIIDFVKIHRSFDITIEFSNESTLLDTGGGLKKASPFFDDTPFVLFNVDVLTDLDLQKMLSFHKASDALVTLAVRSRKTSRYFLFDDKNRLAGWENVKSGEKRLALKDAGQLRQLSFMGIHIISPKIFNLFPGDEIFSIVELYLQIAGNNLINGFHADSYSWTDCGRIENLEKL